MSTDSAALCRTFRVGRYRLTLTSPRPDHTGALMMTAEWHPHLPTRLNEDEIADYRRARDAFVRELLTRAAGGALVLEA